MTKPRTTRDLDGALRFEDLDDDEQARSFSRGKDPRSEPEKWPRTFFRIPPEMGDGQHWTLCETDERGVELLLEHVRVWAHEMGSEPGEAIEIDVVEMGKREFDALPQI